MKRSEHFLPNDLIKAKSKQRLVTEEAEAKIEGKYLATNQPET